VELSPERVTAHLQLGCALLEMDEEGQALPHLRRATELAPTDAPSWFHLGRSLVALGGLCEGESCFHRMLGLDPDNPVAFLWLGQVRMRQGRLTEALELFEAVLARISATSSEAGPLLAASLGKSVVDVQLDVHHYLAESGEPEASLAGYRAVISDDPQNSRAWINLAVKFGPRLDESEIQAIGARLSRDDCSDEEQAGLHFGGAKLCDARGEYPQAADHARRANLTFDAILNRGGKADRPEEYRRLVDFHVGLFTREYFSQGPSVGIVSDRPVFIVGMPRSGTSLVEQILAGHPQIFGAGELMHVANGLKLSSHQAGGRQQWLRRIRDRDRSFVQAAAQRYLTQLSELDPLAARVTDKMPDNFLHLGWLSAMFPGVRIIHCCRDMRDVALSCWMNRLVNLSWSTSLDAIGVRIGQYRRLMEHWSTALPQAICHVRYEEVTGNLEVEARRMIEYCGLPWDERCLDFHTVRRAVNTASHMQVREPLHRRSVRKWEAYAEILGSELTDIGP
jgi:tetratricopeptide (TPR) repeat protein